MQGLDAGARPQESFFQQVKAFCRDEQDLRIERKIGRVKFGFVWRAAPGPWGRFGGGWNWSLGFQAGRSTVMLNLLVAMLRVSWHKEAQR
jgi:hypothetical protein